MSVHLRGRQALVRRPEMRVAGDDLLLRLFAPEHPPGMGPLVDEVDDRLDVAVRGRLRSARPSPGDPGHVDGENRKDDGEVQNL